MAANTIRLMRARTLLERAEALCIRVEYELAEAPQEEYAELLEQADQLRLDIASELVGSGIEDDQNQRMVRR